MKQQAGFTLLELMLACALSLFLLLGLMQIYLAVQKNFILQNALISIEENGRFAAHFLSRNIRLAGYAACVADRWVDQDLAIHGYQDNLPAYLQGKVVKGNDSVEIGRCQMLGTKEQFSQEAYIISDSGRKNAVGGKIYALYLAPMTGNKRELVSGIMQMKIKYGVASVDGKNIASYLSADQVTDWLAVRAVEIALSIASEQPVFTKAQPWQFSGVTMLADRFLHGEWQIYISLRERS